MAHSKSTNCLKGNLDTKMISKDTIYNALLLNPLPMEHHGVCFDPTKIQFFDLNT